MPGRARRHSHIASQPAALRRAQPLPPYPAPQRRKIRARSHTRKQAQTAAAIWQAARWGRESAAVRARCSRWCQKGRRPMRSACSCPPPWERGVGVHLPWVRACGGHLVLPHPLGGLPPTSAGCGGAGRGRGPAAAAVLFVLGRTTGRLHRHPIRSGISATYHCQTAM